jgi:thymidylate kinase
MAELSTKLHTVKLSQIEFLLEALHKNDIMYCHWKSNLHLNDSMTGDTDLDILFQEKQKVKIESILTNLGFKLFSTVKQKQYKDIVDFIGLDLESGKVIHLHTHYRLTLGEPYLKGFQLDFEEKGFESRCFNKDFGIYCINPAFELILLILRESLKFRHRDVLLINLRKKGNYGGNILQEYNWLRAKVTDTEIHSILKTIFNDHATIYNIVIKEFKPKILQMLAPLIRKELAGNRLYTPTVALVLRWKREATILISRKLGKYFSIPIVSKRINPRGGLSVALIGADGSGKSTITRNLKETFEEKLDVYQIYFGRGDGKSSRSRKILTTIKNLLVPGKKKKTTRIHKNVTVGNNGFSRSTYKCIEALLVAREKKQKMKQMDLAKKRGMLVICDRFPQNQIMGYNDGPLLHNHLNSRNFIYRAAAKMESKIYAKATDNTPDIIFKLIASLEVVEARKPGETSIDRLNAKINGIKMLSFNNDCKVITIDATCPINEVLYKIKKEIWELM